MLAKSHRNMKNTHFRSAHSLLSARRIADFRILLIALLTMMFTCEAEAANSGSATQTISEDGLTSTWTELNFAVDKSTTYGNNGLYFNAGTDGNISTNKGAVNIKIGRIMYVLVPSATATGTLTIVGSNTSSDRTVKLNSGQTIAMTKDNGASAAFVTTDIETITEQGYEGTYIKVISQSDFKFTSVKVTLTNGNYNGETVKGPYCISIYNSDNNRIEKFTQVGQTTEYVLKDFVLPGKDGYNNWPMCWVGENDAYQNDYSDNWSMADIPLLRDNDHDRTMKLSTGAKGTLHIWSDRKANEQKNLDLRFVPDGYGLCWGKSGAPSWNNTDNKPFHRIAEGSTIWETDILTLTQEQITNWEYYVGYAGQNENEVIFAGVVDNENQRNSQYLFVKTIGFISDDGKRIEDLSDGARGLFRIHDNYDDVNWYCRFVPYYNYILYKDDGTEFFKSDYISSDATDKATTFPTNAPTKEGYECVGWARTQNATSAEITTKSSYTYWTPNDKFYPVWNELPEWKCTIYDTDGSTIQQTNTCFENSAAEKKSFTLPSAPTTPKAGYKFIGWTKTQNATTADYKAGATYTLTAADTDTKLYPVWIEQWTLVLYGDDDTVFRTLTCLANAADKTITLPEEVPTKSGFQCVGWISSKESSIADYAASGEYTFTKSTDALYPLWEEYNGPSCGTITNTDIFSETLSNGITIYQIDSDGRPEETGTSKFSKGNISSTTQGNVLSAQRCALRTSTHTINTIIVRAYNSNTNRTLSKILTSSTAAKGSYTELGNQKYTASTVPDAGNYEFTIAFTSPIAAGTYIRLEFSNSINIYEVCFEGTKIQTADLAYKEEETIITEVTKEFGASSLPILYNPHNLTPIQYTSSDSKCATVDEAGNITYVALGTTIITATWQGDATYPSDETSYTLHVVAPAGKEFSATLSADNPSIGCNNATLSVAIEPDNASVSPYQWYSCDADGSNETLITDAAAATYTTDVAGTYKVLVTANGYPQWTNTVTITKEEPESVEIKRLTPFHYYRQGCNYTGDTDHPIRHLFLVDSKRLTPAEGQVAYTIRLSKKAHDGTTSEITGIETSGWLYPNGDTLMMDLQHFPSSMVTGWAKEDKGTPSDTLVISLVPLNSCDEYDKAKSVSMDIIVTEKDRRALAFIVSGCDPTSATPYEPVLGGDFFTDIHKRNLWLRTGKDTWDENTDGVLWGGLRASNTFIPTAVNGYAEFDIFNYEPFDIIMLSDYVRTNATGNAGYAYFDKLAQLVDYRPILSLKSHMSRKELTGWRAKGFLADPVSLTGATEMKVLCLGHTILSGIEDTYFNKETGILNVLKEPGYEDNKGLQGFLSRDLVGFVNIGYIDTGADGKPLAEPLIACCERQNNLAARMMILSINSEATPKLTPGGVEAIRAMLYYLMETSESKIEDCSNVFDNNNGTGDHNWSNTANWTYGHLPLLASNVQIMADCNVDMMDAAAGVLKIESGKKLTINADASLRVAKRFGQRDGNLRIKPLPNGDYSIVTIKADADGSGTLIHSAFAADATHPEGYEIPATVEYYSIASGAPDNCQYQWMASPVQNIPQAEVPFAGAWVYGWDTDTHTWGNYLRNGDSMTAFDAYCFTQRTGGKNTYTIQGKLVNIQTDTIALSYNTTLSAARRGINVIGNSWTAPINISGWTDKDFQNCAASIILFNTGFDPTGEGAQVTDGTNLAGQYSVIPIKTASNMALRYQVIPAMQAFQVNATGAGAKLTMDYDRLVRTDKVNRQPMHIQGRRDIEGTESTDPEGITTTLRIYVKGERYGDQVYIFRNAACTAGYDNGWDGHKILGAAAALQLFVESEGERYAVSTQPELAGTRLAFFKGEDDTYTMEFDYDGEETLYLYDSNTDLYTPVLTGNTYFFRSETTKLEHRFLLTDSRPEEPSGPTTGIVEVDIEDNSLILSNTTQDPVTLSIFDAAGRLCYQQTLHTPLATIPVPDIPGVYMVEAASRTQHVTRKIIL